MSDDVLIFLGSAGVTLVAGFIVRLLALGDQEGMSLAVLDFTRDLFAAAAAVFPTTLIIEAKDETIEFAPVELGGTLVLIATIALWAKGDTRYFAHWREGKKRKREAGGMLSQPVASSRPRARKAMAFLAGNGLGFTVLFSSTVLSQQVVA